MVMPVLAFYKKYAGYTNICLFFNLEWKMYAVMWKHTWSSLSLTEGCDVTIFSLAIPWVWRAVGAAVWNKGLG